MTTRRATSRHGPPHRTRMQGMSTPRLLTSDEVAAMLGVTRSTIQAYKSRGQMPQPDVQYGRTPLWLESTIQTWRANSRVAKVARSA